MELTEFVKDGIQITKKHCLQSSRIQFQGNKKMDTTSRYIILLQSKVLISKKKKNEDKCWGRLKEKGTFIHCWWE